MQNYLYAYHPCKGIVPQISHSTKPERKEHLHLHGCDVILRFVFNPWQQRESPEVRNMWRLSPRKIDPKIWLKWWIPFQTKWIFRFKIPSFLGPGGSVPSLGSPTIISNLVKVSLSVCCPVVFSWENRSDVASACNMEGWLREQKNDESPIR